MFDVCYKVYVLGCKAHISLVDVYFWSHQAKIHVLDYATYDLLYEVYVKR